MDILQGARNILLHNNNPSQPADYALTAYNVYLSLDPYLRPVRRFIYDTQARTYPIMLPYLNKAAVLAQDSPAIISVGVLLLFLLIAMQVLNFVRRVMVFWIRLMVRVTFWGGVVMLVAAVWQRGVGKTAEDAVGWGRELNEVWWREYRKWEGYQNQGRVNARASWR
jgi:hypothetical protein